MKKIGLMLLSLTVAVSMFAAPAFANPWWSEYGNYRGNGNWQAKQNQKAFKQMQKLQQAKYNFKDVNRHWAQYDIQRVQGLGLISGYPDRTFKPNSSITCAEAVAIATRLTDNLYGDIDIGDDDYERERLSNVPAWAQGAVMKAYMLKMINPNRFHSHVQASRAQVAVMLAKGMGLKPVYISGIPFKDGILISPEDLGYILALYEKGLIKGTPGGKFNPNDCITRAELAAILSRVVDYLEGTDTGEDDDEKEVESRVSGEIDDLVNGEDNEDDWKIELENGDEYNVDEDVKVYDADGDKIDFWDLDEDDKDMVVLYIDDEDEVRKIYLAETYAGAIEEMDDDEITVDDETLDLPSGFDIDEYLIGSEVVVYVHNDEVIKIEVLEDEDGITVPGEVYAINGDQLYLTIKQDSGNRFTFDVDEDVEINDQDDGDELTFNDIDTGWEVELELDDGEVEEITVIDK